MHDLIQVRGARTHNLKDINLDIPRNKLTVITGLSGSGKSSLAFDTLYAEGQRRYVESLSAYARQFLSLMEKPDVDFIEGLSPAVSIEQKTTSHNPRSTVGTITEIHDYLRLLYARVGIPHCPQHKVPLQAQTVSQMVDSILKLPAKSRWMILAPVIRERKGEHIHVLHDAKQSGYVRARIDGLLSDLDNIPRLDKNKKHTIEIVVDRFSIKDDIALRVAESVEGALGLSDGIALVAPLDENSKHKPLLLSARYSCVECGFSVGEIQPRNFSFNNPNGACPTCDGLGIKQVFDLSLIIKDPQLSIAQGVIRGWEQQNPFLYQILLSVLKHFSASAETPFDELSPTVRDSILYGTKESVVFKYSSEQGTVFKRKHPFEGVIPNMERRYRDSSSAAVRDDLKKLIHSQDCDVCQGMRLNEVALNVLIGKNNIAQISQLAIHDCLQYFEQIKLSGQQGEIAEKILKEIRARLSFLVNVGLKYLSLDRSAESLSGGEAQRIRLAKQIGAALVGVLYILDEPSIGLHQRDNQRLLKTLEQLRDIGNTILVVEHDEEIMRAADYIVDMGPGAGIHGGKVVATGGVDKIIANQKSITGAFLSGKKEIAIPSKRTAYNQNKVITLTGARANNLRAVNLELPVGLFTCITGVSGSGKSSLINQTLLPVAMHQLNRAVSKGVAPYDEINGLQHLDKVIAIDQSPIGRTPRSNPATYTGLFTPIRDLFAATPEARARGYKVGRFSFNVKGGRCENCRGDGLIKVEMHFLPDVYVPCEICGGKRYNRETLSIRYKNKNIHEVLELTVEEAYDFFDAIPVVRRKLQTLKDVGLNYITLWQSAITLSGGEAQRIKLSRELSKMNTGKTLYVLDEPTTGLHFYDIQHLLDVLHKLRDQGSTVIVIEHNLDVIKTADWIIDIGPEGGEQGGRIIASGTPEQVAQVPSSHTGKFLKDLLG